MTQEPKRPVAHQPNKRRTRGTALAQMLALAAEHQGLTNATMAAALGVAPTNVSARIADACRRGHLFRAERGGYELHWFDTAERAQAWAALPPLHKPELVVLPTNPQQTILTKKKGPAALTKFTAGSSKRASVAGADVPIDYSRAKRTVSLAPAGRFDVPASFRGDFSTGGKYLPGINPMTGEPWGARA